MDYADTGMMVTMAIDDIDAADRRLVEQVLLRVDGVSAYRLTDDGLLTVAFHGGDEEFLLKTLHAAGILPRVHHNLEASHLTPGGPRAC